MNFPRGDAVGVAADDGPQERLVLHVAREIVVTEDDVAELPRAIGDLQRHHDGPIVDDPDLGAALVGERVDAHLPAIREEPEGTFGDGRLAPLVRGGSRHHRQRHRQHQGEGEND